MSHEGRIFIRLHAIKRDYHMKTKVEEKKYKVTATLIPQKEIINDTSSICLLYHKAGNEIKIIEMARQYPDNEILIEIDNNISFIVKGKELWSPDWEEEIEDFNYNRDIDIEDLEAFGDDIGASCEYEAKEDFLSCFIDKGIKRLHKLIETMKTKKEIEDIIDRLERCICVSNRISPDVDFNKTTDIEQTILTIREKQLKGRIINRIDLILRHSNMKLRDVMLDEKERFEEELKKIEK